MFRFNQRKVNSEVDELKKLLAITKGAKASNKSISASFLKESVDITGNPIENTPPAPEMGAVEPQGDPSLAQTDDTKEIQKAISNSTIISSGPMTEEEGSEQTVRGYVSTADDEKGLYFKFSTKENSPMIQTKKAVVLDDNLLKSITQIGAYFETWKQKTEK
jgi:hypothetical protein